MSYRASLSLIWEGDRTCERNTTLSKLPRKQLLDIVPCFRVPFLSVRTIVLRRISSILRISSFTLPSRRIECQAKMYHHIYDLEVSSLLRGKKMIVSFHSADIKNQLFVIHMVLYRNGSLIVLSALVLHDCGALKEKRLLFLTQTLHGNHRLPSLSSYTLSLKDIDKKVSFKF